MPLITSYVTPDYPEQSDGFNPAYPVLQKAIAVYVFNDGRRTYSSQPWVTKAPYSAVLGGGSAAMVQDANRLGRFLRKSAVEYAYMFAGTMGPGATSCAMLMSSTTGNVSLFGDGSKDWGINVSGNLVGYFSSGVRGTGTTNIATGDPFVVGTDSIDSATKGYVNGVQEVSFSGWGSSSTINKIGYTGYGGNAAGLGVQAFVVFNQVLTAAEHAQISDILLRGPMEMFAPVQCRIWVPSASGVTITCSVGDSNAAGVASLVNQSLSCAVGNANASGVSALLSVALPCAVGNASAAGVTANISAGSSVTITCSVGDASASGQSALVSTTVQCSVANAASAGVTALIQSGAIISASVGNAVSSGITAAINVALAASVGNANASGVTATIQGQGISGMLPDSRYTVIGSPPNYSILGSGRNYQVTIQ